MVPDLIFISAADRIFTLLPAPIAIIPVAGITAPFESKVAGLPTVFSDILSFAFINISAKDICVRFFVTFRS